MPPITRRDFGASLAGCLAADGLQGSASRRPNIVFVCSDQHNGRVMGCNGDRLVKTPNMDRLASMGTVFRNTYCSSPVCCPSRAGLMTGMFPSDVGSYCNSTAFNGKSPTWASRFRDAGYYCWATGKLDLAPDCDLGFKQVDTAHGNFIEPDITSLFRSPVCYRLGQSKCIDGGLRTRPYQDESRVKRAAGFLAEQARSGGKPWLMYLGTEQPKDWGSGAIREFLDLYPLDQIPLPNIPPGHLEDMHIVFKTVRNHQLLSVPIPDARARRARAAYYARVTETDDHLGTVLGQLERDNALEKTIVVYTSDHGEQLGEHGLWHKNTLLEGSARVPLIIAGPGVPKGKRVDTAVSQIDLVPTLFDLAGVQAPGGLRGHSLLPLMNGDPGGHPCYAISECHSNGSPTGSFMVREGDWKYIYFSWERPLLFNLKEDPDELVNRAGDAETKSVRSRMHGILTSLVDPDGVTLQAFSEQDRRLQAIVKTSTAESFRARLASRLGKGQAAVLANKYFPERAG